MRRDKGEISEGWSQIIYHHIYYNIVWLEHVCYCYIETFTQEVIHYLLWVEKRKMMEGEKRLKTISH
jgi:hypothetical protein